jgi:hypothetical protein
MDIDVVHDQVDSRGFRVLEGKVESHLGEFECGNDQA